MMPAIGASSATPVRSSLEDRLTFTIRRMSPEPTIFRGAFSFAREQDNRLVCAILRDTPERVQAVIAEGGDVNAVQKESAMTPLIFACLRNAPEGVRVLLDAGADPYQIMDVHAGGEPDVSLGQWNLLGINGLRPIPAPVFELGMGAYQHIGAREGKLNALLISLELGNFDVAEVVLSYMVAKGEIRESGVWPLMSSLQRKKVDDLLIEMGVMAEAVQSVVKSAIDAVFAERAKRHLVPEQQPENTFGAGKDLSSLIASYSIPVISPSPEMRNALDKEKTAKAFYRVKAKISYIPVTVRFVACIVLLVLALDLTAKRFLRLEWETMQSVAVSVPLLCILTVFKPVAAIFNGPVNSSRHLYRLQPGDFEKARAFCRENGVVATIKKLWQASKYPNPAFELPYAHRPIEVIGRDRYEGRPLSSRIELKMD